MKNYFKKILLFIKEEYKFLLVLFLITIIALYPVKYYIVVGGGIKDIGSRVKVKNSYKEKGSFNISYVTEINGTVVSYLLSYVIPSWSREKEDNYKYNNTETIEEIEKRNLISLDQSSNNAIYYAYTLANKEVELKDTKFYILTKYPKYDNPFKVGDELKEIDSIKIEKLEDIRQIISKHKPNDIIDFKVIRNNKEKMLKIKVYKDKEDNSSVVGIIATTLYEYTTDPKVNVKFAVNEAGPSGGLITALSIYNKLVKKDITKGKTIAGTGTMEPDGTVGSIGGIEYKLIGANKHADYFLVPSGKNYKEAKKIKKEKHLKIKLIPVKSLKDAINKLDKIKG